MYNVKIKKKFQRGWEIFNETFPHAPKNSSALVRGLQEIFCVTSLTQLKNYAAGRTAMTTFEARAVEKLFRQFNIYNPWDDEEEPQSPSSPSALSS